MSEEEVRAAQNPAVLRKSLRWEYQTQRDDRLFETGWFVDFRKRWQDDLKRAHLNFVARMEAI